MDLGAVVPTTVSQQFTLLADKAEASLKDQSSRSPIRIQIGSATCEQAAGADEVFDEFRKHVAASGRTDILLHRTGCTGRCSREPIVGVFVPGQMPIKYERVDRNLVHEIFTSHVLGGKPVLKHVLDGPIEQIPKYEILTCGSERCCWKGERSFETAIREKLAAAGVPASDVPVTVGSCFGACNVGDEQNRSHMLVRPDKVLYRIESESDLDEVVRQHILGGQLVDRLEVHGKTIGRKFFELYGDVAFFNRQSRVALRHNGVIDPESMEEYFHYRGFQALVKVLETGDPQWVIDEVGRSKLRGRGGGGFATGQKWAMAAKAEEKIRYIICNADEGDPGAFMDRSMLESDPLNVIEGMIIGGYAIGAQRGFFYVRAEYPMAIRRIQHAIDQCHAWGLLGKNILGSGFDFDLEIRLGAGAFVCGEETALIHSIEGERGQPRIRPPYPTESGLWGKPTVINNVETFANVPAVINYGADWFGRIGTEKSGGTKVFALAGKIRHTGLVEVPMGTTLREVVYDIGGGVADGKQLKAIQTGGPAGGCIPAKWIDIPIDFDTPGQGRLDHGQRRHDHPRRGRLHGRHRQVLRGLLAGRVVRQVYALPRRQRADAGDPREDHLRPRHAGRPGQVEAAGAVDEEDVALRAGPRAPNPVLSTLEHFHDEYLAHVVDKKCPAHRCTQLIHYEIDAEKCVGCTLCGRNCPAECISGARKRAARDRPAQVHQVRAVFRGLPV